MPSLELLVERIRVRDLTDDGDLTFDPPAAGMPRLPLRRLTCLVRVPPVPGARPAIVDTGCPVCVFPHHVWSAGYGWRAGRDYDELRVAGRGAAIRGQILQYAYTSRLVRLRVGVELAGLILGGPRLRLDALVCQLADPDGPPYIVMGLWGGLFENRRLVVDCPPGSGDLAARLEW